MDRFSRQNAFQKTIYAEAYRNPELGKVMVDQNAYVICVNG